MFINTCRKIKNPNLEKKIKEGKDSIYPKSYTTRIDILYKLNIDEVYKDIKNFFSKNMLGNEIEGLTRKNRIYIYFNRIEITRRNANKIQKIDTSYIQRIIEDTLEMLIDDFKKYQADKTESIIDIITFLKIPYKPRYVSYKPFKSNLEGIRNLIKIKIEKIAKPEKAELLKKITSKLFSYDIEKNNVFTGFFLPLVLFTFDKIKELVNKYRSIAIYNMRMYNEKLRYLFGLDIKENEPLILHSYFELSEWGRDVGVTLGDWEEKYEFIEFLTKFFVLDFQQYVKNTTGKNIRTKYALAMLGTIFTKVIALFTLHYLLASINLKLLFKSKLYPETISLRIAEKQDGLEISDGKEKFTFEKYNAKFLNDVFPPLKEHRFLAFFMEAGVPNWSPVDDKFFHHNKFTVENNFLFVFKIMPEYTWYTIDFERDRVIETYGGVDAVLRALDFLTDGHYEKDFLYKIAFILFNGKLEQKE